MNLKILIKNKIQEMLKLYKISKKELIPTVWDGGETFEYFIYPQYASYNERNFNFRVSCASIQKAPSNFTKLPNYSRYLVMLDGDLHIKRNAVFESYRKQEVFKFNSNDDIVSFSLGNDFNLMVSDEITQHEVQWIENTYESNFKWVVLFALNPTQLILNNEIFYLEKNDSLIIQNDKLINIKIKVDCLLIVSNMN